MEDAADEFGVLRSVEELVVPNVGAVLAGQDTGSTPWRVVDASGAEVDAVSRWLADLHASDYSAATLRSYAYDLLSWLRFLAAVEVQWARATRWEVRDWVRWSRVRPNPQRQRGNRGRDHRPPAGSVNSVTGKVYLPDAYGRASINHRLSALSSFYEYALGADLGPLINPVPKSRRALERVDAHTSPMEAPRRRGPAAPYRQRLARRTPRALSDDLYEQVFSTLRTTRDRAIVATAVTSGLRASELLSMRRGLLHAGELTTEIEPKGGRGVRVLVPIPVPAFVWIARYLAERPPGPPDEPVWMTVQGTPRPLTYWALRQVLERVNSVLGSNVTMHDFRHTFCSRLSQDENLTIVELQELMRHASITSTTVYLRPQLTELVDKLQQHWDRPPSPPPAPAAGYDGDDLQVLFGGPV